MKKSNEYRIFLSAGFRLLAKIFIKINKDEKKEFKKISRRIKKKIKKYLSDFEKKIMSNKREKSAINILLNITFKKFLYLAKFPFKKKQNQLKTLPKKITAILSKEIKKEKKIFELKKQNEIFLDDLNDKNTGNNYYKVSRGNNKCLIKLLNQKCYDILKIITSDKKHIYEKYKNSNKKRNFQQQLNNQNIIIKKNSDKNNKNNEKYKYDHRTSDNFEIFEIKEAYYSINEIKNKNNFYYDNKIDEENLFNHEILN